MMKWLKELWRRHVIHDDPHDYVAIGQAFIMQTLGGKCPNCWSMDFSFEPIPVKQRVIVRCNNCKRGYWVETLKGTDFSFIGPTKMDI